VHPPQSAAIQRRKFFAMTRSSVPVVEEGTTPEW